MANAKWSNWQCLEDAYKSILLKSAFIWMRPLFQETDCSSYEKSLIISYW